MTNTTTEGDTTMPDTDNTPVTQEEIEAVTIKGMPAMVKAMLARGVEPEATE